MSDLTLCILVEKHMTPIPEDVEVLQEFGREHIHAGANSIRGTVTIIRASKQSIVNWLKPFDGVWITKSPMLGTWEVYHIKDEVDSD